MYYTERRYDQPHMRAAQVQQFYDRETNALDCRIADAFDSLLRGYAAAPLH